jgi:hypothetical protein
MHGLRTKILKRTASNIPVLFKAAKNIADMLKQQKEKIKNHFSEDTKESCREVVYAIAGITGCGLASQYYVQNPEILSDNNIKKYINNMIEPTIPATFLTKSLEEIHKDISHELESICNHQSGISSARSFTSQLSPAFTVIPALANSAFVTSTLLSTADAMVIMRLLRIKKIITMRPEIIPEDKKQAYLQRMSVLDRHMTKEVLFDLTKFFYRGQIVAVNRKLRENEKPQKVYKNSILKEFSEQRIIPLKNNLNIVGITLPVSYLISKLSSEDTKLFKENLQDFNNLFKQIVLSRDNNNAQEILKNTDIPYVQNNKPTEKDLLKRINSLSKNGVLNNSETDNKPSEK